MGRKHKFVNKTHYPDWAIERFTRYIFDDVLAFFATEEGQREYEQWEAEQQKQTKGAAFGASSASCEQTDLKNKKRAVPNGTALVRYLAFFLRGPLGLELGKIGAPLGKHSCS